MSTDDRQELRHRINALTEELMKMRLNEKRFHFFTKHFAALRIQGQAEVQEGADEAPAEVQETHCTMHFERFTIQRCPGCGAFAQADEESFTQALDRLMKAEGVT